jgi:uncharacterized protein (DUF58 family)
MQALFIALLLLFLFGALLRQDWIFYLAYVVAGVWLFSNWSVRRSLRFVDVKRSMLDRAFVGQKIPVTVEISNHSRVPLPWIVLEERVPLDLRDISDYRIALSAGGRSTTTHTYTVIAKRRGYFTLGPLSLRSGDLFGFAEANWEEVAPRFVTVYPLIFPLGRLGLPSRIPIGGRTSTQRLYEDPARLAGVRAYVAGDSQRRIHWKASAHANELLVKKYQPAIGLNCMIALDFVRPAYTRGNVSSVSEWAVSIVASLAAAVTESRQPVGLLCRGIDAASGAANAVPLPLPARTGQAQLTAILSTLARLELSDDDSSFAAWLTPLLAEQEWGTTVVVVTPQVSDELLWALHLAMRRGSTILLLLCGEQADARAMGAKAERLGIEYHQTLWEKDVQGI